MKEDKGLAVKLEKADGRGEIYSIELGDGEEVMLLHSKRGSLRGGHSHNVDEVVIVLSGEMGYRKLRRGEQTWQRLMAGAVTENLKGEPHLANFAEDSWVLEKKLCKKGESKDTDYEPWRALVRESMEKRGAASD